MPARSLPAALAAALLLVLTACAAGDEDGAEASGTEPSAEVSESPSEPETSVDGAGTPAVAPADGIPLEVEGMTAHAPRGWVAGPDFVSQSAANPRGGAGTAVVLYSFPVFGSLTMTTDDLAQDSTRSGAWQRRATRQEDVVIDGVPAFHVAGHVNPGEYADVYGVVMADRQLTVEFTWQQREVRAHRERVIGSVLASVDLGS